MTGGVSIITAPRLNKYHPSIRYNVRMLFVSALQLDWAQQVFCVSPGRLLQEGLEGEDGGGVQEGQLGLRSQERRPGEHFLTRRRDLRPSRGPALRSCAQLKEENGRTDGRKEQRGPVGLVASPTVRLEKNSSGEWSGLVLYLKKEKKREKKRDARL